MRLLEVLGNRSDKGRIGVSVNVYRNCITVTKVYRCCTKSAPSSKTRRRNAQDEKRPATWRNILIYSRPAWTRAKGASACSSQGILFIRRLLSSAKMSCSCYDKQPAKLYMLEISNQIYQTSYFSSSQARILTQIEEPSSCAQADAKSRRSWGSTTS